MSQPFDPLLRELIPAFAGGFVRLLVPELVGQLAVESFQFQREEYFLPNPRGGRPRRPDLVGRVPILSGGKALLHVEIEHRYRSARVPGFFDYNQLLRLSTGLPVHTLVVYCHGGEADVREQVYEDVSLGRVVTRFGYHSLGLSRMSPEKLLGSPEPLAWAFAALAKPGRPGRPALRVRCLERIIEAADLPEDQRFRLFNFVATTIKSDKNLADEYDEYLQRANREVQETMMTWADGIKEEGRLEGHKAGRLEGHKVGRKTGRLEGMQEMVLEVLEERFARVPTKVTKTVKGIQSVKQLQEIVRRAAVADSLADVGIA